MAPDDIKGMKIRPAHATIATFVTMLGGNNVQASAPEVRDVIESGVADAITFPWGSIPLFGIDKVVKFHMDAPLYVTTFALVINKARYDGMSAAQKKVIDDHCTNEWAGKVADPWADFEAAGKPKMKAEAGPRGLSDLARADRAVEEGRRAAAENLGRRRAQDRRQCRRGDAGIAGEPAEARRARPLTRPSRSRNGDRVPPARQLRLRRRRATAWTASSTASS